MPPLPIEIQPYSASWPAYFSLISHQLHTCLNTTSVPYTSITHIGSTSIPHLAAKPNIDIAILVPSLPAAILAREALIWEPPGPEHYHGGLREEYAAVKWEQVAVGQRDGVAYGRAKNAVVAKILRVAGWTDEEVRRKEALDVREEGVNWDDEPFT
ncbi:uncharacterized protein AB675_1631 [Cyphellophora attinorum]|uniref:Uncharacterized protein n=1 Tax=Cyphellophora attinorum TaxID=1664694 RepID=A0A0N1H543_9EURO|nr:uncharacterized protein AB675_1631 [Phialophora attinorum]KPI36017.1 hypothetical protein AB675_1631 [Phialophora attinorum]